MGESTDPGTAASGQTLRRSLNPTTRSIICGAVNGAYSCLRIIRRIGFRSYASSAPCVSSLPPEASRCYPTTHDLRRLGHAIDWKTTPPPHVRGGGKVL